MLARALHPARTAQQLEGRPHPALPLLHRLGRWGSEGPPVPLEAGLTLRFHHEDRSRCRSPERSPSASLSAHNLQPLDGGSELLGLAPGDWAPVDHSASGWAVSLTPNTSDFWNHLSFLK